MLGSFPFLSKEMTVEAQRESLSIRSAGAYGTVHDYLTSTRPDKDARGKAAEAWSAYEGSDSHSYHEKLRKLRRGNRREWAWLLIDVWFDEHVRDSHFETFRALSPFAKDRIALGSERDHKIVFERDAKALTEALSARKPRFAVTLSGYYHFIAF
jgi:hypothetical protein